LVVYSEIQKFLYTFQSQKNNTKEENCDVGGRCW
jgi:hypothetical protein